MTLTSAGENMIETSKTTLRCDFWRKNWPLFRKKLTATNEPNINNNWLRELPISFWNADFASQYTHNRIRLVSDSNVKAHW